MIDIIPNHHPIFVHFTVALFSAAFGFHMLSYVGVRSHKLSLRLIQEFATVGRWCLWACALLTFLTIAAGLYAYYTVGHDVISHAAMTTHRNWAIPTAVTIWLVALWSLDRYLKQKSITLLFMIALLVVQCLVLSTAWLGGELVYRYGLGVMALPQAEETSHQHTPMPKHAGMNAKAEPMNKENPAHGHSAHN